MRSAIQDILPPRLRRSLAKFGQDISIARRKRRLSVASMTERLAISKGTYLRVEKGDPTVSMGTYAMTLFVLGFATPFEQLVDQSRDEQGLLLDSNRLPKRIRARKEPQAW